MTKSQEEVNPSAQHCSMIYIPNAILDWKASCSHDNSNRCSRRLVVLRCPVNQVNQVNVSTEFNYGLWKTIYEFSVFLSERAVTSCQPGSARYEVLPVWYPSSTIALKYTNSLGSTLIHSGLTIHGCASVLLFLFAMALPCTTLLLMAQSDWCRYRL